VLCRIICDRSCRRYKRHLPEKLCCMAANWACGRIVSREAVRPTIKAWPCYAIPPWGSGACTVTGSRAQATATGTY